MTANGLQAIWIKTVAAEQVAEGKILELERKTSWHFKHINRLSKAQISLSF